MRLTFEEATLLLPDYKADEAPPAFFWDARVDLFHAQAHFYRESLDYNAKVSPLRIQLRATRPSR